MPRASVIDRSIVAVFDIEGFSTKNPKGQAGLVKSFVEKLDARLAGLSVLKPDAYSTGDGAIVSIGRHCKLGEKAVKNFLDFVINLADNLLHENIVVRVAVNYAEKDWAVPINSSQWFAGQCIQVGDGINIATRALGFCEPREVMFTEQMVGFLRKLSLESVYPLVPNEPLLAKHELPLQTYTYDATSSGKGVFYSPSSPTHAYKRFGSFPSAKTETVQLFLDNGLAGELMKGVSNAYDTMRHVNDTKTFLSWNEVLQVLTQVAYDPDDSMYVLSRNEKGEGFWTQRKGQIYIDYLKAHAVKNGGFINQTRVLVYNDEDHPDTKMPQVDDLMPEKEKFDELRGLHSEGTLRTFPASALIGYERLAKLFFGFTVSKKHGFAIISVPATKALDANALAAHGVGDILALHRDYNAKDGPMKAIITADERLVRHLLSDMEKLLGDPLARPVE